jgi:serine/threonine protein kinase
VVTHEFGRTHDGGQYLVQEFLEGSLVHFRLKRGDPLSLPERIDIIRQAASALAVVHEAGFVHRDICPRNLMLSPKGRVTLFDFGLSVPDAPPFLRPGNRTGTPNYMAPEVIRRRQCSRQLDIFSFGVTAYEICCGLLPWPGGNARAALAHDTPPPDIRERTGDIPASLAGAIMDCLRAEPNERPDSFRVFLGRIARL